jgi:hypothetical protein
LHSSTFLYIIEIKDTKGLAVTTLPLFPEHEAQGDDTPLPLLVAKKWNFPLAFHIVEGKYMYAIQDWLRGLTGLKNNNATWGYFKKQDAWNQLLNSIDKLPYISTDGKKYSIEFIDDKGLYTITQYLRIKKARPTLLEIRKYLATSGAFVDEIRLDPKTVLTSGAISPDQALDAVIEMYRQQGKDDAWIQMRIQSKIKRDVFIKALGQAVYEVLTRRHYALATNDVYVGLWGRTAARLKTQLNVPKNGSLRDRQPTMALHFQGIAEEAAAYELKDKEEITWSEAREIIQTMAEMIKPWIDQMSQRLRIDIATGTPLLRQG